MEPRITGYTLIDGDSETDLIEKVNKQIKYGDMQPLGGPILATLPNGDQVLYQAMVTYAKPSRSSRP